MFTSRSYHLVAQSSASRLTAGPMVRLGVGNRLLRRIRSERVSERGFSGSYITTGFRAMPEGWVHEH